MNESMPGDAGSRKKRRPPWRALALVGVPLLLIGAAMVLGKLQGDRARAGLVEPQGLGWMVAGEPVEIRSTRTLAGDLEAFTFEFVAGGALVHALDYTIDHDLFGGGFVGGLDVDGDGELELVLATRAGRAASRVLEPGPEGITDRSFDEVPEALWTDIAARLEDAAPTGFTFLAATVGMLWLLLGLTVYALIALWKLLRLAARAGRARRSG